MRIYENEGNENFQKAPMTEFFSEIVSANFRPVAVTVVCAVGFILSTLGIFSVLVLSLEELSKQEIFWMVWMGIACMVLIAALYGYWTMKRWGVVLYAGLIGVNTVIGILLGQWSPVEFLIPCIVIAVGGQYYQQMK